MSKVKTIAFYLPQFHRIPENDTWWGDGFTEWTNVKKAKPQFSGHSQPNVPTKGLGYYDLGASNVIDKQAELAKKYGIYGFCFYYYWFDGKKLLDKPLENMLKNKKPDFPFCVCWANENWTRRWDGKENEVLISQKHSDQDDQDFINELIKVFKNKRYIKINGKPVLVIYRTSLFPDIKRSAEIWRSAAKKAGFKDIYLTRVEGIDGELDPKSINFDAGIEFAPDWRLIDSSINKQEDTYGSLVSKDFFKKDSPTLYDYCLTMSNMVNRDKPKYKYFRGVFPSWDNTPRRGANSTVFWGSKPSYFQYFLYRQILNTMNNKLLNEDEKIIFVNAWNEWGEGCYLEPDTKKGFDNLNAVKDALLLKTPEDLPVHATIRKLDKQIKYMDRELDYSRNQTSELYERYHNLEKEKENKQKEIDLIKSSRFWKLRDKLVWLKFNR